MKKPTSYTRFFSLWIAASLCAAAIPSPAKAVEPRHPAGYTARAVLPQNQLVSTAGYFHLLMEPAQKQIIEVEVTNHRETKLTLSVAVNGASTNANGLIAYTEAKPAANAAPTGALPLAFRHDLLQSVPGAITQQEDGLLALAPLTTVRLPFEISMPDERIEGQALYGIVLSDVPSPGEEPAGAAMSIQSVYSYAIAVLLQSQRDISIAPDFVMVGVSATKQAGHDAVTATIRNTEPLVITGASVSIQLFAEGETDPVLSFQNDRVSIAPRTDMPFTCALPMDAPLPTGVYTVHVDLRYNDEAWPLRGTLSI